MRLAFWIALLATLAGALPVYAQREKLPWDDLLVVEKTWPNAKRTATGLRYLILTEGSGDARPQPGDMVSVLFEGRFLDGKIFNKVEDRANPFKIRIGRDNLIAAWEEALKHMRRGEKRLLIVPYELGYGSRGNPELGVPRRATLVFEVELVDFGKS